MTGLIGADVEDLRSLARVFRSGADRIADSCQGVSTLVHTTQAWAGPDAQQFRAEWDGQHRAAIQAVVDALRTSGDALVRNADDQEKTSAVGDSAIPGGLHTLPGHATVSWPAAVSGLTDAEAQALLDAALDDPSVLAGMTPEQIKAWWAQLDEEGRQDFLEDQSLVAGNLPGIPFDDRAIANQQTAAERLTEPGLSADERKYLEGVVKGDTKLVMYDPENERIVEMIGTMDDDTTTVVTYVPGTDTKMSSFYQGYADPKEPDVDGYDGVQQIGHQLVEGDDGTVVFVYKDGKFPAGDGVSMDGKTPSGIPYLGFDGKLHYQNNEFAEAFVFEAKDQQAAVGTGQKLADFQDVLGLEMPPGAQSVAVGHSWGLANITTSETLGAHYDKVVSLSGAWMPDGWTPSAGTEYSSYAYPDILNFAQATGAVADQVPWQSDAFEQHWYEPGDAIPNPIGLVNGLVGAYIDANRLMDNHNLISTDDPGNARPLDDVRKFIYG